ncbi:hypothetical protein GCM10011487_40260 [Steroidobacter agaridevorans]|uniref:Galactose oxidase n=1 Tax=Steroidobacter agaridevorans TaxID=2695856 RepID=A0A829YHJ7_9GAMM|nr:hypothetical protein GCM10011487_40260 [Steroidobacter agaridevorans]
MVLTWGDQTSTVEHQIDFAGFGDERTVSLDAESTRTISVHRANSWRGFLNEGAWRWRDGAGLLAKDGGLYLLGGWNSERDPTLNSEVWFTSDAQHWRQLTAAAPWPGRHGAGWLVHGDRLYVIAGDLFSDVWSSRDGVSWRLHTAHAPFGPRYTPNAASDGERIFVYGGQSWISDPTCATGPLCGAIGYNDVWLAAPGNRADAVGGRWTRVLPTAPWGARGLVHGAAFFKGRIYVVGGGLKAVLPTTWPLAETVAEFSDVWSSADGVNWRLEAENLGIPPRTHFALLATEHGCYLANGSVTTQPNTSSEVFFASDCVHYAEIRGGSPLPVRHASSLAYFNGSIVVLGGHGSTAGTVVWQYFPDVPGEAS